MASLSRPDTKIPATNRHHGGPGSSHQRADLPDPTQPRASQEGETTEQARTNVQKSKISGGGGERDSHHTHDPEMKGET